MKPAGARRRGLCHASNRAMLKNMHSIQSFCLPHRPEVLGTTRAPTNQSATTTRTVFTIVMSTYSWETRKTGDYRDLLWEGLRLLCCLRAVIAKSEPATPDIKRLSPTGFHSRPQRRPQSVLLRTHCCFHFLEGDQGWRSSVLRYLRNPLQSYAIHR
jgi:hypothetical protein